MLFYMLEVESLFFSYDEKPLLCELSFAVGSNEIVAIVGTSGSGKTTLFRLITGLISPQKGHISIATPSGTPRASYSGGKMLSYMRQEDLLLPWRTVLENVLISAELGANRGVERKTLMLERARALLYEVGLQEHEGLFPDQLSGGMRQRVALARTLLLQRPLLLLDEPFRSLDILIREELYQSLRTLAAKEKKTVLFITHDFYDALHFANRILVLREGRIAGDLAISNETRADPVQKERVELSLRSLLSGN